MTIYPTKIFTKSHPYPVWIKSSDGQKTPKLIKGNPIKRLQSLKSCPLIKGINQPIKNGIPNPIKIPNSLSIF